MLSTAALASMSTSAVSSQNGASSVPANASSGKAPVQPTEVGWLFVPQYYTFLNNDPNKLHCFYTKKSTLVHGTESEETPLCFGQQVSEMESGEDSFVLCLKRTYTTLSLLLLANSRQDRLAWLL